MSGAILTFLRYHVIGILVNDPGALLFWSNVFQQRHIASNEIIVPRSAFEVELATRSIARVANPFFIPRRSNDGMDQWLEVDRVEEMFRNAMDSIHHSSPFVYISFVTFKLHLDPLQRSHESSVNDETSDRDVIDIDPNLNPANWATSKHLLSVLLAAHDDMNKFMNLLSWFIDLRMVFYVRYSYWIKNHMDEAQEQLRRNREREQQQQHAVPAQVEEENRSTDHPSSNNVLIADGSDGV
jgi:hypothetical protein